MFNERGNSLVIGIIIGFLIAGGLFGAYMLGIENARPRPFVIQVSPSPSLFATASPMANVLPEKWSLQKSSRCNVSVPLPPKEAPYVTSGTATSGMDGGAFWQFDDYDNSPSQSLFNKGTGAFYRNPDALGSGYIAGRIGVQCAVNNQELSTEGLMAAYEKWFNGLGNSDEVKIASKKLTKKWGRDVWEVYHKGGMNDENNPQYFFATSTHIYNVNQVSMTDDSFVKKTTNQIFENLTFQ